VLFYGFATYGNAGYLREQVCKYMCPYARFQSAMFDQDTMIISYDVARGEPRGSRTRLAVRGAQGQGDCVDCNLCVQVCPTGIDIRQGLQNECIGCAACIDACDTVMDRMRFPRGLIRFATQRGLAGHWSRAQMLRRVLRPRVLIYFAVLVAIVVGLAASLAMRSPFRVDVVRDRGTMARLVEDGRIENVYRLQLMNASESRLRLRVSVDGLRDAVVTSRDEFEVGATESRWVAVSVQIPPRTAQALGPGAHAMAFEISRFEAGEARADALREKSTFVVPR
jgi:cytochrome c oxidase accessory protein FixG